MKRIFINQSGNSNKFWTIEEIENSYTVTWGKIGTEGRSNDKSFSTVEECSKKVEKLIKEKQNKDYKETDDKANIPDKPILEYKPMNEEIFFGKSFRHLIGKIQVTMIPF